MSLPRPAHDEIADAGGRPDRTVFVVHGILGGRRNWRSFARRLVQRAPHWRVVLVDLRNHGDSPALAGPHDLAACAADLTRLSEAVGVPAAVVGHSFGGKVALRYVQAARHAVDAVWVLETPPGAVTAGAGFDEVRHVLASLRSSPVPAPDRQQVRHHLVGRGLPEPVASWLLTSLHRTPEGWHWKYDLDGVTAMLDDYARTDLWPAVFGSGARSTHLVRAADSNRWDRTELARFDSAKAALSVATHVLANAGHVLHADNPSGLLDLVIPYFAAD